VLQSTALVDGDIKGQIVSEDLCTLPAAVIPRVPHFSRSLREVESEVHSSQTKPAGHETIVWDVPVWVGHSCPTPLLLLLILALSLVLKLQVREHLSTKLLLS
jgi:hypothetical protein